RQHVRHRPPAERLPALQGGEGGARSRAGREESEGEGESGGGRGRYAFGTSAKTTSRGGLTPFCDPRWLREPKGRLLLIFAGELAEQLGRGRIGALDGFDAAQTRPLGGIVVVRHPTHITPYPGAFQLSRLGSGPRCDQSFARRSFALRLDELVEDEPVDVGPDLHPQRKM